MTPLQLVHISPMDSEEIPAKSTLFYMFLEGQVYYNVGFTPLTDAVMRYLQLDIRTHRISRLDMERLQVIFTEFWENQYEGINSQRFIL